MTFLDNSPKDLFLPFRILLRIPVPWVFLLAYYLGLLLARLFPEIHPALPPWAANGGYALLLVGSAAMSWPLVLFFSKHTTTKPGMKSKALVVEGPYRISRNPMYVGLVVFYLGAMLARDEMAPLMTLALTVAYLQWVVIPIEEKRLSEAFGKKYTGYRARVRRWL